MTEQQVKDEVIRYIDDYSYNYAILLDGEWGCGKTHFILNQMYDEIERHEKEKEKPRLVKYISLYGCKTIHDVQENIAWSFAENAREKISDNANWDKKTDNVSKNILLSSKKIGNAILKKFLPETSLYEISSDWLNLGAFIFVFDDLERCDCSLNEVFGFLNELVEHENTKVIIVANEREIWGIADPKYLELQYGLALDERIQWANKGNSFTSMSKGNTNKVTIDELETRRKLLFLPKEDNPEYKKIREKLIGTILRYEPNLDSIITLIIENSNYSAEIKGIFLENKKLFTDMMNYNHHKNLRTFQFFLSKANYLIEQLMKIEIESKYRIQIYSRIIRETFGHAIKLKANYQKTNNDFYGLKNEQDFVSETIKNYVDKGEFVFEKFEYDVRIMHKELKSLIPMDDAYYMLYQEYYRHTQKWCETQIETIIKKLEEQRYPLSFFVKIIISVQRLIDIGFDENYMQRIKAAMKKSISFMDEVDILKGDLWFTDDKTLKEKVRAVIEDVNIFIIEHSKKAGLATVNQILESEDWVKQLTVYNNLEGSFSKKDMPVFSKGEVSKWVENILSADPKTICEFRSWLAETYPSSLKRESYAKDADAIKSVRAQLEEHEDCDLIKKQLIKWLAVQLNEIIQCNERV